MLQTSRDSMGSHGKAMRKPLGKHRFLIISEHIISDYCVPPFRQRPTRLCNVSKRNLKGCLRMFHGPLKLAAWNCTERPDCGGTRRYKGVIWVKLWAGRSRPPQTTAWQFKRSVHDLQDCSGPSFGAADSAYYSMFCKKKLRGLSLKTAHVKKTLVAFDDWSNADTAGVIRTIPAGPVKSVEEDNMLYTR